MLLNSFSMQAGHAPAVSAADSGAGSGGGSSGSGGGALVEAAGAAAPNHLMLPPPVPRSPVDADLLRGRRGYKSRAGGVDRGGGGGSPMRNTTSSINMALSLMPRVNDSAAATVVPMVPSAPSPAVLPPMQPEKGPDGRYLPPFGSFSPAPVPSSSSSSSVFGTFARRRAAVVNLADAAASLPAPAAPAPTASPPADLVVAWDAVPIGSQRAAL